MLNLIKIFFILISIRLSKMDFKCPFDICDNSLSTSDTCNINCQTETIMNRSEYYSSINSLNFQNLAKLSNDAFSNLDIIDLKFYNCPIKKLDFKDVVRIDSIVFDSVPNLGQIIENNDLNVLKDKLKTLTVKNCKKLSENMTLKLFNLASHLNLTEFTLSDITYKDLNLENSSFQFEKLFIHDNFIQKFKLKISNSLKLLDLSDNKIKKIEFQLNSSDISLVHLNLNLNPIGNYVLPLIPTLKVLSMTANKLTALANETFQNLVNLEVLHLDFNVIKNIENGTFYRLKKLVYLDLCQNLLYEDIKFFYLESLTYLGLAGNKFKTFNQDIIENLVNIEELDLSDNFIETISLNITKLKRLYLDNNRIKSLSDLNVKSLTVLSLYRNKIDTLENFNTDSKTNLYTVYLLLNNLRSISKYALNDFLNTKNLYLENNLIDTIEFPVLDQLEELNLLNNKIRIVNKTTFSNLKNLKVLTLSYNNIVDIEPDSFMISLIQLNLDNNFLSKTPDFNKLKNLKSILLYNQNMNLDYLDENFFSANSKNYLEINLITNNITKYSPHVFCNSSSQFKITMDDLNYLDKCILKQLEHKNVTFDVQSSQTDCSLVNMARKMNLSIQDFFNYTSLCDGLSLIDDCDQEYNLIYNCNYDLNMFKRNTSWLFSNLNLYSFDKKYEFCFINENDLCLKSKYFVIYCSGKNNSYGIYDIKIYIYDAISNSLVYLNLTEDNNIKNFEIVILKNDSIIINHNISNSLIILAKNEYNLYSLLFRSTRYFYSNAYGLLKNGCNYKNKLYFYADFDFSDVLLDFVILLNYLDNKINENDFLNDRKVRSNFILNSKRNINVSMSEFTLKETEIFPNSASNIKFLFLNILFYLILLHF